MPAVGVAGRRALGCLEQQLRCRVRGAPRPGLGSGGLQLAGHCLIGIIDRQCQVAGTLLGFGDDGRQARVEYPAICWTEGTIGPCCQQWVRELDAIPVKLEDTGPSGGRKRRRRPRIGGIQLRHRRASQCCCGGQRPAAGPRQRTQASPDQVIRPQRGGQPLEVRIGAAPLERPGDLQAMERVAARLGMDPGQRWSSQREAELTADDRVGGIHVQRPDVDAKRGIGEDGRRRGQRGIGCLGADREQDAHANPGQAACDVLDDPQR